MARIGEVGGEGGSPEYGTGISTGTGTTYSMTLWEKYERVWIILIAGGIAGAMLLGMMLFAKRQGLI